MEFTSGKKDGPNWIFAFTGMGKSTLAKRFAFKDKVWDFEIANVARAIECPKRGSTVINVAREMVLNQMVRKGRVVLCGAIEMLDTAVKNFKVVILLPRSKELILKRILDRQGMDDYYLEIEKNYDFYIQVWEARAKDADVEVIYMDSVREMFDEVHLSTVDPDKIGFIDPVTGGVYSLAITRKQMKDYLIDIYNYVTRIAGEQLPKKIIDEVRDNHVEDDEMFRISELEEVFSEDFDYTIVDENIQSVSEFSLIMGKLLYTSKKHFGTIGLPHVWNKYAEKIYLFMHGNELNMLKRREPNSFILDFINSVDYTCVDDATFESNFIEHRFCERALRLMDQSSSLEGSGELWMKLMAPADSETG